ncbi:T9SS type A sorting domain-containing protein [Dyadobacter sp. 676]|uniref:T9SS type A sorting domain-containing protein n=1 Tax=Dyadobacter sp. 676 TaxID=3088362 RepID=A0AAU8FV95_9BACT
MRCPDIKKAFYTNAEKKEIVLIFDEGQDLKWPADSTVTGQDGKPLVLSLKNFFYLDGNEKKAAFSAGKAEGNRVTLTLKEPSNATKLSYLPSFYPDNLPLIEPFSFNIAIYTGPYLRNKRNLGAFSFDKVSIGTLLPNVELSANRTFNSVILSWKAVEGATGYVLEKKTADTMSYVLLENVDSKTLVFEDKDIEINATYTYRIQAVSDISQSAYATARVDLTPILGVEQNGRELTWEIYPNPVDDILKVGFRNPESGVIEVFNATGQSRIRSEYKAVKNWEMNIAKWPAGIYLLQVEQKNGIRATQKFIKR